MTSGKTYPPASDLISLKGKAAIITGGAMGIGLAIARRFGEAGAALAIADVNAGRGERAAQELTAAGYRARFTLCDVSKDEEAKALVAGTAEAFGGVHVLVNNAAVFPFVKAVDMPAEEFRRVLDVNVKAPFVLSREAARQMIAQKTGGAIVNMASVAGLRPSNLRQSAYDASKGSVITLTKSLAAELGPHRIRVNAVCPGATLTERMQALVRRGVFGDFKEGMKEFTGRTAMGRMGNTDEIARVVLFLASDLSAYMTGAYMVVDGGYMLS